MADERRSSVRRSEDRNRRQLADIRLTRRRHSLMIFYYNNRGAGNFPMRNTDIRSSRSTPAVFKVGPKCVYPISRLQREIFSGLAHPEMTDLWKRVWTVGSAIRIRPRVDVKRASRAFDKVAARHDCLRMRFTRTRGHWEAVIDEKHLTGVVVQDIGTVSDQELADIINAVFSEDFDFEAGPLAEQRILRCGDQGDVMLCRMHHLITDGWSMSVIVDELVKASLGIPLWGRKPIGFAEYLERFDRLPKQQEIAADRYWSDLLLPVLPMPEMGRITKGVRPNYSVTNTVPGGSLAFKLTGSGSNYFSDQVRQSNVTRITMVMAAFARALSQAGNTEGVYLNTNVARTHAELARYVGLVVYTMPVRCSVSQYTDIQALARAIHTQCRQSLPHTLSDACILRESFDQLINSQGGHLRQFACVMNNAEYVMKSSLVGPILQEEIGKVIRVGSLEIDFLPIFDPVQTTTEMRLATDVAGERYSFDLAYDNLGFEQIEAERMLELVIKNLGLRNQHIGAITHQGPEPCS